MRISDWSSDVCSSDLTSNQPPAQRTVEFGNARFFPRRQRDVAGEPLQRDSTATRLQAVPRAENGFTRFFDQAVPFTAFIALSLPTKGNRSTLLAAIFLLHLRHSPCFIRTYAEPDRTSVGTDKSG